MTNWLSSCGELLRIWWFQDRIRVSPAAGRLLRLKVGDRIAFQDDVYTVQERHASGHGVDVDFHRQDQTQVGYQLASSHGFCSLVVTVIWESDSNHGKRRTFHATLNRQGKTQVLFDDDLVLLPRNEGLDENDTIGPFGD